MLQVYLDPCTVNSRKVLAGLDLLNTQYELKHVDYFAGAHKKPTAVRFSWGSISAPFEQGWNRSAFRDRASGRAVGDASD